MILIVGDKNLSSWSLRPWLAMKQFGVPFEERLIFLDRPETGTQIRQWSPSGKVPALIDGQVRLWESMAIMEYLAERFPDRAWWPADPRRRAWARAVANEMHGGFGTMRSLMPHKLSVILPGFDTGRASADIARVKEIWTECLSAHSGGFLFGREFGIADAMYAPVVNRFVTYDVKLTGALAEYRDRMLALPAMGEWKRAALTEPTAR